MRIMIIESTTSIEDMADIEMMMLARNQLKIIDDGYQELHIETPEWVSEKQIEVSREIAFRVKSELQRQLKTKRARRAALATADEKRQSLDTDITELEKQLE